MRNECIEAAKSHGVKVLEELSVFDWSNTYRTEVTKISHSKPDAIFAPHHSERVLRRMKELHLNAVVLSTSNILEPLSNGALPCDLAEGVFFPDWLLSKEFKETYLKKFGKEALFAAQGGYDAMKGLQQAFVNNPSNPADGIRSVKFNGAGGPIDFGQGFVANYTEASLRKISNRKIIDVN